MQISKKKNFSEKYQFTTVHTFSYEKNNRKCACTTDFADIIQITAQITAIQKIAYEKQIMKNY